MTLYINYLVAIFWKFCELGYLKLLIMQDLNINYSIVNLQAHIIQIIQKFEQ